MSAIPADIIRTAEETFDLMCHHGSGLVVRGEAIHDIACAILAERERVAAIARECADREEDKWISFLSDSNEHRYAADVCFEILHAILNSQGTSPVPADRADEVTPPLASSELAGVAATHNPATPAPSIPDTDALAREAVEGA